MLLLSNSFGEEWTIISAHHVTADDFVHCQILKHVTFKGVARHDVLVYNKLEVLTDFIGRSGKLSQQKRKWNEPA